MKLPYLPFEFEPHTVREHEAMIAAMKDKNGDVVRNAPVAFGGLSSLPSRLRQDSLDAPTPR